MTPATLPCLYLARHGETEWSRSGRHTGRTDIPLTAQGELEAAALAPRLAGIDFDLVLTSPLLRAARTCLLAGFGAIAVTDPDLVEWDYGDYEGLRRPEILAKNADWHLFRDGCPNGESPSDVARRAERVIARVRAAAGNALVVSSGHFLRMLAARWVGAGPQFGSRLVLGTASLGILGYEHDRSQPAIRLWNETRPPSR